MNKLKQGRCHGRFSRIVVISALLVTVTGLITQSLSIRAAGTSDDVPDFSAVWERQGCLANGITCPFELATLPLTARAIGFREAFDESLGPKYDCVQATIPSLIVDPYKFQITQKRDRLIFTYEKDDIIRTIWLEGHEHPRPGVYDFTLQGYSKGRYENGTLVIETTKFLFDPTGLDDLSNLPSSTQKRVIERYKREGDNLKVEVSVEDPLFLREKIGFNYEWSRTDKPLVLPYGCDPEQARESLQFLPSKYKEPGWVRLPAPNYKVSQ